MSAEITGSCLAELSRSRTSGMPSVAGQTDGLARLIKRPSRYLATKIRRKTLAYVGAVFLYQAARFGIGFGMVLEMYEGN